MAATAAEGPIKADRVRSLQSEVEGVKTIMSENVDRILARGEKLDDLMTKTEDLQASFPDSRIDYPVQSPTSAILTVFDVPAPAMLQFVTPVNIRVHWAVQSPDFRPNLDIPKRGLSAGSKNRPRRHV